VDGICLLTNQFVPVNVESFRQVAQVITVAAANLISPSSHEANFGSKFWVEIESG
jgi:hypothetical protein